MRVFSATLATETNTFAPMPTGLAAFQAQWYYPAGTHPAHMTLYSGPLVVARERAREHGWTLFEGLVAAAQPGGITTRVAYETLRDTILADLEAALPLDLALLGLHGAMVAQGYEDCEGDLLARVRALVGPGAIVGALLDPHCHLSAAMVGNADLLVAFKEYPHTDALETAATLVDLCAAAAAGKVELHPVVEDTGMVAVIHTTKEPARSIVARLREMERRAEIASGSIVHGFLWGDVPDMGTKVLAYANGDVARARACAREIADHLVAERASLSSPIPDLAAALDAALSHPGPVVVADSADNPGGGAPGDSTFILRALIDRKATNVALGPLWDPMSVRLAFAAGVGAALPLRIGGKTGPTSGDPVDATCIVRALADNLMMTGLSGTPASLGPSARVDVAGIEVVLTTERNQATGTDLFTGLGCVLGTKQAIVVKSSHHFHAAFAPLAREVVYAATPGALSTDLRHFDFRRARVR